MMRWICMGMMMLLISCKSTRHTYQPLPIEAPSNPKMVFLTFSVVQDSAQKTKIDLIKQKVVEGKLKIEPANSNLTDRLVVKQLDDQQQALVSISVDHPLRKRVEYANDLGVLSSKIVLLKKADFFVRVTLHEKTKSIQVDEVVDGRKIGTVLFKL